MGCTLWARSLALAAVLAATGTGLLLPVQPAGSLATQAELTTTPAGSGQPPADFGDLPLSFEANQGQADPAVRFSSHGPGRSVFLTATEAVLAVGGSGPAAASADATEAGAGGVVRISLIGSNPEPRVEGAQRLDGVAHYLTGDDPGGWYRNVPTYGQVVYRDVYPGVDHVWHGRDGRLEHDFVVAPRANPARIRIAYEGVSSIRLDEDGNLRLETPAGTLVEEAPRVHQDIDGQRRSVSGRFRIVGEDLVGFDIGRYDRSAPLVIDPVVVYAALLGDAACGCDGAGGIAVDGSGRAHIVGTTRSTGFPTEGAVQDLHAGGEADVFVTKLNAAGDALVYSTYLGGVGSDLGDGIAVDSSGNAYITGTTGSEDFPTADPAQPVAGGGGDAFVAKLDPTGQTLVYSTFLGGSGPDNSDSVAVDAAGNAYVTGETFSSDFPTEGAFQPVHGGGETDAFVTKVSPGGSAIVYSTYLGGTGEDNGRGVALVGAAAYITGATRSEDFPTSLAAFDTTFGGGTCGEQACSDAFVTHLDADGATLVYSTYLGGTGDESAHALAVDSTGAAYVTGGTGSADFPTEDPVQAGAGGEMDVFVTKLAPGGATLVYSTYLGGTQRDFGDGIAVDAATPPNAYLTGLTDSDDFPTRNPLQAVRAGGLDAFVTKLDGGGTSLAYSTYLGGAAPEAEPGSGVCLICLGNGDVDSGGIAVDAAGNAYVSGTTASDDFPTQNPIQFFRAGGTDAFVAKLAPAGDTLVYSTYLGGEGGNGPGDITVDHTGAAFVTGHTAAPDLGRGVCLICLGANDTEPEPVFQPLSAGGRDAYVVKLDPAGDVVWTTYLGGQASDRGTGIAVDAAGRAHVLGETESANFPTTAGAPQPSQPGLSDLFVTRLAADGSALEYSTYLGGGGEFGFQFPGGIAVDPAGAAYVTGTTSSDEFPVTPGAFQEVRTSAETGFVTKFDAAGTIEYSTFLGGSIPGDESSSGITETTGVAIDASGSAYVTGHTSAADFPVTPGAFQSEYGGNFDFFVTKFEPDGADLVYSTYLGGSGPEGGACLLICPPPGDIAVDGAGAAYITGATTSADFPTRNAFQAAYGGGEQDVFAAKLNPAGTDLDWSTYFGGSGSDRGHDIAVDAGGFVHLVGDTTSDDLPVADHEYVGGTDPFVGRFDSDGNLADSSSGGGPADDTFVAVATDDAGDAYVLGLLAFLEDDSIVLKISYSGVDLAVTKTDDGPGRVGEPLTYIITVANLGGVAAGDVVVTDTLPAEVEVGSAETSQGSCSVTAGDVVCELGTVPGGDSATVTIVVTPTVDGTIENTATVTSPDDRNPANNSSTVETEVTVPLCFGATIVGTDGNDIIRGTDGDDIIDGRGGDDRIDGRGGNDTICGGDGNDRITGGKGDDTIEDTGDEARIDGGDGNDTVAVTAGTVELTGGRGHDNLLAVGDDLDLDGGAGADDVLAITGGFGGFTATASTPAGTCEQAVRVATAMATGTNHRWTPDRCAPLIAIPAHPTPQGRRAAAPAAGGDGPHRPCHVGGGDGEDNLLVIAGRCKVEGGTGPDIILVIDEGGTGPTPRMTIDAGSGHDTVLVLDGFGGFATATADGPPFVDRVIRGGSGNDDILTGGGNDHIDGGPGDDTIVDEAGERSDVDAGSGNDTVEVHGGIIRVDLGDGHDLANLSASLSISVDAGSGDDIVNAFAEAADATVRVDADGGDDTVNVFTSGGTAAGLDVRGGSGDDILNVFGGGFFAATAPSPATAPLRMDGGAGDDILNDFSVPGVILLGGPGDDRIATFDEGAGRIDGGGGNDWIDATQSSNPVDVTGGPGDDTVAGSPFDDVIRGGAHDDVLTGSGGSDQVSGEAGQDTLDGLTDEDPEAADTLDGGPGRDTCLPSESDVQISCGDSGHLSEAGRFVGVPSDHRKLRGASRGGSGRHPGKVTPPAARPVPGPPPRTGCGAARRRRSSRDDTRGRPPSTP